MKKIDIEQIAKEVILLFAVGCLEFLALYGAVIVPFIELTIVDLIKFSFLFGLSIWVCESFILFLFGDGFKRYLKREYRIAWVPIDKEMPKEPKKLFPKSKKLNYQKYVCLVKNGTNDAYCEILLTYSGNGKWMSKGEDISDKVFAWKKSL